jgi:hypothetical protein
MSIFKESFKPEVRTQLDKRKTALQTRSSQDLTYLTSRNAWVRMTSGVDTINDAEGIINDAEGITNYNDTLAKKYILQAGTLNKDESLKSGIGESFSNAYSSKDYGLGLRPMPGITDVKINSKSTYGSLREATIDFKCWDLTQLEELELLFMRPGYLVLLEWGWSPYLSNRTDRLETIKPNSDFKVFEPVGSLIDINKQLYSASIDTGGNYDSMMGKIKNYSWKFRPDGGYDCTTTLISYGEVIESLKINYAPTTYLFPTGSATDGLVYKANDLGVAGSSIIGKYYQKNILSGVIFELYSYAKNYVTVNGKNINEGVSWDNYIASLPENIHYFAKQIETSKSPLETQTTDSFLTDPIKVWITLESFCNVLNKFVLPQVTSNNTQFPLIEITTKDDEGQDLYCIGHPLQVSVDPTICLIDSPVWKNLGISAGLGQQIKAKSQENIEDIIAKSPYNIADSGLKGIAYDYIEAIFKVITAYGGKNKKENTEAIIKSYLNLYKNDIDNAVKALLFSYENNLIFKEAEANVNRFFLDNINLKILVGAPTIYSLAATLKNFPGVDLNVIIKEYTTNSSTLGLTKSQTGTIPKAKRQTLIDNQKVVEDAKKSTESAKLGLKFLDKLNQKYFLDDTQKHGVIGNIYVNLGYLYSLAVSKKLESQDKKDKDEIALFDYIKSIMKGIQGSIGNINNFEPHVRNDSILEIIDINFAAPPDKSAQQLFENVYELPVQGLESIVRNISFESQIFPEQSAMISIAASTKPSSFGTDTSTLTAYNRGIKNRIIPEIIPPYYENTDLASINYNIGVNLGKLTPYFVGLESYFIDGFWFFDKEKISSFDVAKSGDYKDTLKDLIATTKNFFADLNKFSAIIPTKLTFTIDGIGGIIIGTLFKIPPGFMPAGYKGSKGIGRQLGYIVTNLGHNIQSGDWTTDIIAQTIILEDAKDEGIGFDYSQILVSLPDGRIAIGASTPISRGTVTTKVPISLDGEINGDIDEYYLATISTQPKYKLYSIAADLFIRMEADAKKAGFTLPIVSAYRTVADQERVYKQYDGVGVALPGTSPHGWAIAIDINPSHFGGIKRTTNTRINEIQRQTKLYKWLEANASKYNFYNPPALQDGQGYDEWWHWEYWDI